MCLYQKGLPIAEQDMETLLRKSSCESLALQTNKGQWEGYRTLRLGETGPAVKQLQDKPLS